jgi:uncharacterized protein
MPAANLTQPLAPVCDVLLNGQALTAAEKAHVTRVTVEEKLDAAGMLTLEFFEPLESRQQPTWLDDLNRFALGSEIEIKMGYADDLETLMVGDIMHLQPSFAQSQFRLTVRSYDRSYRLHQDRKPPLSFLKQKASDIAVQIAQAVKLTPETTDSQFTYEYLAKKPDQSDWKFLADLARSIDYEVRVEGKKLIFRPAAYAESAVLTLSMAADLLDFTPRLSLARQVKEVIVRGWDPKEKKAVIARAGPGEGQAAMDGQGSDGALSESTAGTAVPEVSSPPVTSQAEADQRATAMFNQHLLSLVTGEGSCFGRTDLRPGQVIKIEGVIQPFNGQYYVTRATHIFSQQGGYRTTFDVQRNAI